MTTINEAIEDARRIVETAEADEGPTVRKFLMLSGGNDSMVLLDVCGEWADDIVHINTGIGIPETTEFVRQTVADLGRPLIELSPPVPYDDIVLGRGKGARPDGRGALFGGFPGPGSHHFIYTRLKERCVERLLRDHRERRGQRFMLLTGIRNAESKRRMGYASATDRRGGQVWVNPLLHWPNELMRQYRTERRLPVNEVTVHLHMSGECLCGAFARPGELDEIGLFYPEFARRIRDLEAQAKAAGMPACKWGVRPPKAAEVVAPAAETAKPGPLCHQCSLWEDELAAADGCQKWCIDGHRCGRPVPEGEQFCGVRDHDLVQGTGAHFDAAAPG